MALWIDTTQTGSVEVEGVSFTVRVLTARDRLKLFALKDDVDANDPDALMAIIRLGIKGWQGDGAPACQYDDGRLTLETLDLLNPEHYAPLVDAIVSTNQMGGHDAGN